ncbi:unnamed protein product [Meloidogyne enterolobii]|uniref:Uncharacterized protein n=1 Tax=Meloidogyne enterolobii TaxID=390850 RepID=A0ACB0YYM5_MELEN
MEGNGFVNLINDGNIKYFRGKVDKIAAIYAENSFEKPKYSTNYSLFYFEIKCKIEGENNLLVIGLANCVAKSYIRYNAREVKIKNCFQEFNFSTFPWNDGDIFGCGVVYPPNKKNRMPYAFFTQNGKLIGKAILLNDNINSYNPYVHLKCCSAETNFGNDLETTPFCYDISKHYVLKEFY